MNEGLNLSQQAHETEWSAAIFAAREDLDTLKRTLDAVINASRDQQIRIDLLVNGNSALGQNIAGTVAGNKRILPANVDLRVWSLALADKAETWNRYVHDLWIGGSTTFFLDGYVQPTPHAFQLLHDHLAKNKDLASASGFPITGRHAKNYRKEIETRGWGLHGNLYALPRKTVDLLRDYPIKIPKGLYRNDGFLGAVLAFDLSPEVKPWNAQQRLGVAPGVGWVTPERHWWKPSDLVDAFKRKRRQAIGDIENSALRMLVATDRRPYSELPDTISEIIELWVERHPEDVRRLCRFHLFRARALTLLRQGKDWTFADQAPVLIFP